MIAPELRATVNETLLTGGSTSELPTILKLMAMSPFFRTYAVVPMQTTLDQRSGGPQQCG